MEILCRSDYQDMYRIKEGVLLVVQKWEHVLDEDGYYAHIFRTDRKNSCMYNKGCQKMLKILTDDYLDTYRMITYPKGTVLYNNYIIRKVSPDKWKYEIKTTGDLLSGDYQEINRLLDLIKKTIEEGVREDE